MAESDAVFCYARSICILHPPGFAPFDFAQDRL